MREVRAVADLPSVPAVYAMYGQTRTRPAYVGIAKNLKTRLRQHLVLRDSSVTTGSSVVALNPRARPLGRLVGKRGIP
jgi:excinuclease UvrABC nuclease subunit